MEKECTVVLSKNKAPFKTRKWGKQKDQGIIILWDIKMYFQKVDQHIGGKWLIHGNKGCKDNQVQSL